MEDEVNALYRNEIYLKNEPFIIKIQRLYRSGVKREKLRKNIKLLIKFNHMQKHLFKYDMHLYFVEFIERVKNMGKRNYFMKEKKIKVDKHK